MRPIVATLLCWTLVLSAQQAPPQQPATTVPKGSVKFESSTLLVVEDIIMKDKSGKPITGLKASDFIVTEDGKPQKVEFVEFQTLDEEATQIQLTKRDSDQPEVEVSTIARPVTQVQIAPERPGDIKYKDRRLMVMFFDMTSMPISDQIRAQSAAETFIKNQMTKSDLVAIMTFSNDIKVVEDFTDDRDQLLKDIRALVVGEGQGFATNNADDAASDDAAAFSQDDSEFNIF